MLVHKTEKGLTRPENPKTETFVIVFPSCQISITTISIKTLQSITYLFDFVQSSLRVFSPHDFNDVTFDNGHGLDTVPLLQVFA